MPRTWQEHPCWRQRTLTLDEALADRDRVVVVSAHPDDESLGVGGLIAGAHRRGRQVYLVLLTAGEDSHPPRRETTRHALATQRLAEMDAAIEVLAPGSPVVFLGAPDGGVSAVEDQVVTALGEIVGDGSHTVLVAPWRHDGHDDHDAAGRAAARVAADTGAALLEYPVLMWRTTSPADAPWEAMRSIDLDDEEHATKLAAIRAHASQLESLSTTGSESLSGPLLDHFTGPAEHVFVPPAGQAPADASAGAHSTASSTF
ncbi:PIG-L deacetylase family protein [Nocardioides acrostichi]|uniref:PIG-L family deacetylase n=1 Tax=Nocardioides acrostichi TaxID=2784339 RepID=A0A930UW19_9ACTN|nr:PIG-L family deacetylase [Nocardioides acrostichi]MBF4160120.1 PIG-L family deacetylase [Nocardioides acrostichi]